MHEIISRGKRIDNDEWAFGSFCMDALEQLNGPCGIDGFIRFFDKTAEKKKMQMYEVDRDTVGTFSGIRDEKLTKIFDGDIVKFLCYVGAIVFENGAYGLAISGNSTFDWDYIEKEAKMALGTSWISACRNDHFISLWEIMWNFNCEDNVCHMVEVIGNIHDNPELLEG